VSEGFDPDAASRLFGQPIPQPVASGTASKRPLAATFACWIAIAPSALHVFAGLLNLLLPAGQPTRTGIRPLDAVFENMGTIAVLQAGFGLLVVAMAVAALRRIPWARRGTQVLAALRGLLAVAAGVYLGAAVPRDLVVGLADSAFLRYWKASVMASGVVWWLGLAAVVVYLLERREVKSWFRRSGETS
jgi:hypothetical protein